MQEHNNYDYVFKALCRRDCNFTRVSEISGHDRATIRRITSAKHEDYYKLPKQEYLIKNISDALVIFYKELDYQNAVRGN